MVGNGMGFHLAGGSTYPEVYKHFKAANEKYLHRSMGASEVRPHYGRPRSDATHFEKAGIPTMSLYTTRSVKPVYYHLPGDDVHSLTPEIMEDAARLLFLSLTGIANEE